MFGGAPDSLIYDLEKYKLKEIIFLARRNKKAVSVGVFRGSLRYRTGNILNFHKVRLNKVVFFFFAKKLKLAGTKHSTFLTRGEKNGRSI